ncbi:MAG: isoprenylcysteine carboxylmethyltransferase family protein [Anaerolineales bacterium]
MPKVIILVLGTLVLVYISRASLRQPGSHGFYRFFAWESILGLFVLNMEFWFDKPFAWNQVIAWTLLFLCIIPLAFGVHSLRTRGRPVEQRAGDPSLLAFEKTTALVTSGIYHYIRHPLYSSLFLLAWGIFFKLPSWLGLILAAAATGFLIATARADEAECTRFFGPQYQEYMRTTRMFVPYIF